MPHDTDLDHEHEPMSAAEHGAIAEAIWAQETVELRTVGIDIGSSTSHLLFARVILKRLAEGLSSRFVAVQREVVWRSPIMFTPFRPDGTMDAKKLEDFVRRAYRDAGLRRSDIDSGAVILTGEAMKQKNARAIDEIFAEESGKFVCASAGHKLESILAAHGSGATGLSRRRDQCALHVDVGGGTTKLALIDRGEIISVAAFAVGGRILAQDETGAWSRIDDSALLVARALGIEATPGTVAHESVRHVIAGRLAQIVVDQLTGKALDELGHALELTEPLSRTLKADFISFSGGVAEYIFGRESATYGDIAQALAREIVNELKLRVSIPIIEPMECIRATVIGASQFTLQVSGKTIHLPDKDILPIHNVPVVHLGLELSDNINIDKIVETLSKKSAILDLDPGACLAIAFTWDGAPEHRRLFAMSQAIMRFAAPTGQRDAPLILIIDGDVGASIGRILHDELHLDGKIASIDGVKLCELEFIDVGEILHPSGVVPIVIKSLLFS